MKVIFLDIDGVLNYENCDASYGNSYFVVKDKLRLVSELVEETGAQIVLTSTWRYGAKDMEQGHESFEAGLYEALLHALDDVGLEIYDCTGEEEACRGLEIKKWLMQNNGIESFVIVDDLDEEQFELLEDFLIQTDIMRGIERSHIELAKRILNEKRNNLTNWRSGND